MGAAGIAATPAQCPGHLSPLPPQVCHCLGCFPLSHMPQFSVLVTNLHHVDKFHKEIHNGHFNYFFCISCALSLTQGTTSCHAHFNFCSSF